jgi:putative ABC transport system permease protein
VLARYVWRDLVRNPRRSLAALAGIALGVGLFSAVLFFIDGSSASMTQRAVSPLPIDMQRVLTAPLGGRLHLTESVEAPGQIAPGQQVVVRLELVNDSTSAANEVVVRSEPPAGLEYMAGTAQVQGAPVEGGETDNPFSRGAAKTGFNVGTVPPGATVTASYEVVARTAVAVNDGLGFQTSFSSREIVSPVRANAPEPLALAELAGRIAQVDGVAAADQLSFVDLPAGSLSVDGSTLPGPVRLFGFDAGYVQRHGDIRLVDGEVVPEAALISVEAGQALGAAPGDTITLALPGAAQPIMLTVSGEVDLRQARSLFFSRQGSNLEDFLYTPNSVVIDPSLFQQDVIPALLTESATRGSTRNLPVREVDVQVARDRLDADPGTALEQTRRIAGDVTAIAAEQDFLIDNISNTLGVAREDAALAKRMFVFLGVPGAMLAAILAGYAGAVLASAQRREQAVLRIRGANRSHLVRMLALRSTLLTAAGAVIGLAVGFLAALAVLGGDALLRASTPSLVLSGLIGAGGGFLAAGSALYGAGRASIRREINEDRAQLFSRRPPWARFGFDLLALLAVGVLAVLAVRADAFAGIPGSVYEGRGVDLNLWLLALPLGVWIAGALIGGRAFAWVLSRPRSHSARFSHVVRGVLGRSLRRRSWVAAQGAIVIGLIVGAATSITMFTASYDRAKAADARFGLGSDIRVAPDPTNQESVGAAFAEQIAAVDGIDGATPVVYGVENSRLRSARNEDAANVAAVDPRGFLAVAAVEDDNFVGMTAEEALATLADDPTGVLLSTQIAEFVSVEPGDPIRVLFGRGTDEQVLAEMHVVGLFERLPAFPDGADGMVNIAQQQRLVPSTVPDFFLARSSDGRPSTLQGAASALSGGLNGTTRLAVETRETTLDKDQSSLAALNIRGLLTLDSGFGLAMAIIAIGIFVFGLLLQRRREYVTMRAQGLQSREIRALIVAETGTVTVSACLVGIVVGTAMAFFLVNVLRPLFVLTPRLLFPAGAVLALVLLIVAATVVSSVAASALVGRLRPTELLRDE